MSARDLTPEERRARGTKLCEVLCGEVASIAPAGIGLWPAAWEMTAPSDAEFLAALTSWESAPGPETLEGVRQAYRSVLDAWRRAAEAYERQGAER